MKNKTYILTREEQDQMDSQERECGLKTAKYYNTHALVYYSCYNVKNGKVFRIFVVDKANDAVDYIRECFDSVKSSVKYNDQVKSCNAQAIGIEFVDIRDLQKKGFIVVELHKDGTFEEINSTELLLAYVPYVNYPCDYMNTLIQETNDSPLASKVTELAVKILKEEVVYNIPRSANTYAVSRAIATFMILNVWILLRFMKYLDKQCGNVVFRVDGRLHYYYPGNGVTADFRGLDYDSATSCEFNMMEAPEGGIAECISTMCAINKLSKEEKACIHTIIDTLLKNPSSELNKVYTSLVIKYWLDDTTCFSDRYAIINGPAVEFVKCDKTKVGSVEDITPSL